MKKKDENKSQLNDKSITNESTQADYHAYKKWNIKVVDTETLNKTLANCKLAESRNSIDTSNLRFKLPTQLVRLGGYTNKNEGEVEFSKEDGISITLTGNFFTFQDIGI